MQRHLDEPWAADGVLYHPQVALRRAEKCALSRCNARTNRERDAGGGAGRSRPVDGWILEVGNKLNAVVRNIEARVIKYVKELRVILQREALRQLEFLKDAEIKSALKWAAENIPSASGVPGFKVVAGSGNGIARWHTVCSRSKWRWRAKSRCVQHRVICVDPSRALEDRVLRRCACAPDGHNWICDRVVASTPEDTGSATAEVVHAIRLSALQRRGSAETPAVDHLIGPSFSPTDCRELIQIADCKNVGTIEIGITVSRFQVGWVVAGEKEAQPALLVESVRVRVGSRSDAHVRQ